MLRTEIIRTCSNEAVAAAAVRSMGHNFYSRMSLLSGAHHVQPGAYAAALVRQFADEADEDAWCALGIAMARRDMPLLAGLRFILESMIDGAGKDRGDLLANTRAHVSDKCRQG